MGRLFNTMALFGQKRLLNKAGAFLTGLRTVASRTLQSVYCQYRMRRDAKEEACFPKLQPARYLGFHSNPQHTIQNVTHLGVCRGATVILDQSEIPNACQQHLALDKMQSEDLSKIQKDVVHTLFQMEALALAYLQFCPLMQGSQNSNQIELSKCCS